MVYNTIYAQIGEERHITLDPINYQYDVKQILVISGETVPEYYEADICNVGDTATLTMIGTAADGVEIPDRFFRDGRNVLVYVVIPGSGGDVQTRYDITIPSDERGEREDIELDTDQQTQADSLIAALNSGVGRAEAAAEAIQNMDVEAETLAAGSAASVEKTVDPETGAVTLSFGLPKGATGNPGTPGQDGTTPDFRIGTVETLNPGQSATATITGTPAQPVLNLGIPQGEKGEPGGDSGTSDYTELSNKPQINGHTLSGNKSASDLGLGTYSKPASGIPKADLASDVQASLGKADSALQTAPVQSVAGKTGAVNLGAGDVGFNSSEEYNEGTVGAKLSTLNRQLSDVEENQIPELKSALNGKVDFGITAYDNADENDIVDSNLISSFKDGYFINAGRETVNANFTIAYAPVQAGYAYAVTTFEQNTSLAGNLADFFDENGAYIANSNVVSKYIRKLADNLYLFFVEAPMGAVKLGVSNSLSVKESAYIKAINNVEISKQLRIIRCNIQNELYDEIRSNKLDCDIPAYALCSESDIVNTNLISSFKDGYYINAGRETPNANLTIASAPVIEGRPYAIVLWEHANQIGTNDICFFDKNNAYIAHSNVVGEYKRDISSKQYLYFFEAPADAVLVRVTEYLTEKNSVYIKAIDNAEISKQLRVQLTNYDNDTLESLSEYYSGRTQKKYYVYNHCLNKPFDFRNKTAVFFGDSVVFGSASAVGESTVHYCNQNWVQRFCAKYSITKDNQAVNGSAYVDTEHAYSILNKVLNYSEEKDIIFIGGGINDWYFGDKPLGVLGDTTGNTFYGALHLVCEKFKNSFPNSTVIFLTIINMSTDSATPTYPLNDFRKAMFEVATQYGFNVIDGSQIGFPIEDGPYKNLMIADGVHPTDLGHEFMFKSICGILE